MKVEFLVNTELGDGRQLFIAASDFLKADKDEDELESFSFATHAFLHFYGIDGFLGRAQYDIIKRNLDKTGAVIITAEEVKYPRDVLVDVYVSNNNRLKRVDFSEIE